MKDEKMALQKSNIERTERMEGAIKDYDEAKHVIVKLDEARYAMNKLMGPNGTLGENLRNKYLSNSLAEHDVLLSAGPP